jgi:hypothetical protein
MRAPYSYIMRDQVRDLVPSLMEADMLGQPRRLPRLHLAVFAGVMFSYIAALTAAA